MADGAFEHVPVLLEECITGLAINSEGLYVDGTAGGAGHSYEIAHRLGRGGALLSIDRDPQAVAKAREKLADFPFARVERGNFSDMCAILDRLELGNPDGILLDLGVSSHQLDTAERGFSYHSQARLDMRMSGEGMSAWDVVNNLEQRELAVIFKELGEERFSSRVAAAIVRERTSAPIDTTTQLAEIIKEAIPAATRREGGHPAKRVFQAIRIYVNAELEELRMGIADGFERLASGGRFAIITFHSLEDRIVKRSFAEYCKGCTCPPDFPVCVCGKTPRAKLITRKPATATERELEHNNRSRSAKLRVIEKQ